MSAPALETFLSKALKQNHALSEPADSVEAIAPLLLDLIQQADTFLEPQHYRSDPHHGVAE